MDLTNVKEKEKQLLQQAKQAQMGEMISMIAHQWRQPLNAISASAISLSLMTKLGNLESKKVSTNSDFIQKQCQKMSDTINTFMNFVKPTKKEKFFELQHTVDSVLSLMQTQLTNHNITIEVKHNTQGIGLVEHSDSGSRFTLVCGKL